MITVREVTDLDMTLYKKDSKGKIRFLKIFTEGDALNQESGLIDGNPILHTKVCKPKNVGKANETSGAQQARKELVSKVNSKLDEGYFETEQDAIDNKVILPMLAKEYGKECDKIDWENDEVFVQPKLDGMRCLAIIKDGQVRLMSRKGKTLDTLDHLKLPLETLPNMILDGEIYAHGKTFQENMKLVKKYIKGETEELIFHVYDQVDESRDFDTRFDEVYNLIKFLPGITVVGTSKLIGPEFLAGVQQEFLKLGYEGTMVRWGNEGYKVNARSSNLLKFKEFHDVDAEIIDIVPADQRPEWGVPVLKYTNVDGTEVTFRSGVRMSHDDRIDMLTNKDDYIGRIANIRYFEMTDEGSFRFPIMIGVHEDR